MLTINDRIQIPDGELTWKFVRSSGPGGQNVNKVASKAVLFWPIAESSSVPDEVKIRLALHNKRFFTREGGLVISSQRFRDQDKNRHDCLEKLRAMILLALVVPKKRKKTRPSRGSKERRLEAKKHRARKKLQRQGGMEE